MLLIYFNVFRWNSIILLQNFTHMLLHNWSMVVFEHFHVWFVAHWFGKVKGWSVSLYIYTLLTNENEVYNNAVAWCFSSPYSSCVWACHLEALLEHHVSSDEPISLCSPVVLLMTFTHSQDAAYLEKVNTTLAHFTAIINIQHENTEKDIILDICS